MDTIVINPADRHLFSEGTVVSCSERVPVGSALRVTEEQIQEGMKAVLGMIPRQRQAVA